MNIQVRHDQVRGCGYRKTGGLYMVSDGLATPCGKLPIRLDVCPTCNQGIKPAQGWNWIDPSKLVEPGQCYENKAKQCLTCPLGLEPIDMAGLIWVGEQHYPIPDDFMREAIMQGVSRRLPGNSLPHGFVIGETWVMLAHRKGSENQTPAIFHAFKPAAVEYIVTGQETDKELAALGKRGITPVIVKREQEELAI